MIGFAAMRRNRGKERFDSFAGLAEVRNEDAGSDWVISRMKSITVTVCTKIARGSTLKL
jgi:hypothetical protein